MTRVHPIRAFLRAGPFAALPLLLLLGSCGPPVPWPGDGEPPKFWPRHHAEALR